MTLLTAKQALSNEGILPEQQAAVEEIAARLQLKIAGYDWVRETAPFVDFAADDMQSVWTTWHIPGGLDRIVEFVVAKFKALGWKIEEARDLESCSISYRVWKPAI